MSIHLDNTSPYIHICQKNCEYTEIYLTIVLHGEDTISWAVKCVQITANFMCFDSFEKFGVTSRLKFTRILSISVTSVGVFIRLNDGGWILG